jgi:hypothetical protein
MVNRVYRNLALSLVSALTASACGLATSEGAGAGSLDGGPLQHDAAVLGPGEVEPDMGCKKMDIVFVVDDSRSMQEEQVNLAANFPKFVDVLNRFTAKNGDLIDYRIAVTTTGVDVNVTEVISGSIQPTEIQKGDNGKFRMTAGMTRPWLERSDVNMTSTFGTIANVGLAGPSWEMPLEGSRRALSDRLGDTNKGFVRDDALLGIVYLTDEDDCSTTTLNITQPDGLNCSKFAEPTSSYTSFFDTLKQGRGRWATAVIAGQTKCTSKFGSAAEATRLKAFVSQVGSSAVFSSICDGDLAGALERALGTFDVACKSFAVPR